MKKLHPKNKILKFLMILLVCVVPLLVAYEAYQLVQSSSSYKVNNVKVAVVNEDRPTQQSNRLWDVGGQLVNKLRDDKKSNVHWHFVSEREAKRELNNGDVDMALIIPTDLSINAASALTDRPRVSNLKIMMAKHNNFLSVQVNQQIANDVKQNVAQNVQAVYAKILLDDIKEMGNQMKIASKGSSQVNGNVLDVKSGKVSVSRNLDLLTQKMLSFQDGSQAIDGQINKNSQTLSNQLNENSEKFGSELQGTSKDLSSKIDSNQESTKSQLSKLSSDFDNQINTLSTGIDTLTINNKKINVNLGGIQDNSMGVGNNLTSLADTSSSANKEVKDYTSQFGNLNNQLGDLSKQTKQLSSDSQTDLTTVNKTNDFVKSSSELIDKVVMMKAIDVSDLAKMKDNQDPNGTLESKSQEIIDKNNDISEKAKANSENDKSALDKLNSFDQDTSIDDNVKKDISSKYITPAKDSLNQDMSSSNDIVSDSLTINNDASEIKSNIAILSKQIDTINKLIPIVQDIDKSPLATSESQQDAKTIIDSLPNVVKTLQSLPEVDNATNKSATEGNNLVKNSDSVNSAVNGLDSSVKSLNDKYGELSNGIKSTKTSSDGIVDKGQELANSTGQSKDDKNQAVNITNQNVSQSNQELASGLQNGLVDLNTSLDKYKSFDPSSMNESMTDQVSQAEKKNNDQLANVANEARENSEKASDNDNKIHDSLIDLINNNKRLHALLTENANKVAPISTEQKNVNSIIDPVNNNISGKTFGSTLNKLFAPTIIAAVLYIGALLTYMLKIYGRKHKELDVSNITVGIISIVQSIGVILVSVYFHVSPSNIVLLVMISTVVALSFNGISLAMNKLMGLLGFIIMILLLVVQVIISNNVIPASSLGILSKVALLLPLTYGVKAFNDVINSFLYTPTLTIDMLILIIYPIILFAISFAIQKYHERKMLEED